jgi:hypothetical protein
MSETTRNPYKDSEKAYGPNTTIPYKIPQKKSFHLNLSRKWV